MYTSYHIVNIILSIATTLWIVYRVYQFNISEEKLIAIIEDYLNIDSNKVERISKLSFTERIKYEVPGSVFVIYNYFFGIITGKFEYSRRVEISNESDQEITKFISIEIKNRKVYTFKVFDSYNL